MRHDICGAWRHTGGLAAMELALQPDGRLGAGRDLLSWTKTTMAGAPLLLGAAAPLGLGRIVALYYRSSPSYQNR